MTIHLSEAAADAIKGIDGFGEDEYFLRIIVKAGGCAGYQYEFLPAVGEDENDVIVEGYDAKVLIDNESAKLIDGATIDYEKTLMAKQFVIKLPNANMCGCGKSFS